MDFITISGIGHILLGLSVLYLCLICTRIYHSHRAIVTRLDNQREMIAKAGELQMAIIAEMFSDHDEEDEHGHLDELEGEDETDEEDEPEEMDGDLRPEPAVEAEVTPMRRSRKIV